MNHEVNKDVGKNCRVSVEYGMMVRDGQRRLL